jgi:hypothetical protein
MKAVQPVVATNGVPYLHECSRTVQHSRKGDGKKDGKDGKESLL